MRDVLKGVYVGAVVATGFSIWVTTLRILGGNARFEALGTSWGRVVSVY